jgi:hypothetical protein
MEAQRTGEEVRRRKLNLYKLPPKNFAGKPDVITFNNLAKRYTLQGREEEIIALRNVSLNSNTEFYSIKK